MKRHLPETKEEGYWWRIGYEAGMKEAERIHADALKIGTPILEAIEERLSDRN